MALKVNLYKNNNTASKAYGLVYGRVEHAGMMDIPALADHIAKHGSIYTKDVILGVLSKMAFCLKELMLDGHKIKLADIGIFYAQVKATPATSYLNFDLGKNIKDVHLVVQGTGDMRKGPMGESATLAYTSLAQSLRDAEQEADQGGDDGDDQNP